ncbi:UNVERIFIED_CONTAM: hypothetical protein Slati_2164300 [Sesamum latifolium]|uniref:Integrase zinc-binding domain-containing protein n=1 Tax=Sesamum latifolium TaxID=2727402 RepID=A0AAW2WWT3_9LAMI
MVETVRGWVLYLARKQGRCDTGNSPRAEYILSEVHEGSCGNHFGGRSLADKVLRQGYFWPSIQKDAAHVVKRCKKCKEHANVMHTPATPV